MWRLKIGCSLCYSMLTLDAARLCGCLVAIHDTMLIAVVFGSTFFPRPTILFLYTYTVMLFLFHKYLLDESFMKCLSTNTS